MNFQLPGSSGVAAAVDVSPDQEAVARASMESLQGSGKVNGNIVTDISPASDFWRAEDYHQRYLEKQGRG